MASFVDAGISMAGDTQLEAFENVKHRIVDAYEHFGQLPEEQLGPHPTAQLAVLREFISERS